MKRITALLATTILAVRHKGVTAIGGDKGAVVGYRFDHPEEMVPGPWTFELWQGELKVAEKRFEILPP